MNFMQQFLQLGRQPKPKVQHFICRDDLNKKKTPLKVKKKVHFESKPLIQNDQNKKNCEKEDPREEDEVSNAEKAVRVKILMRKEEATLLLSKCKNGGVLQLDDVPNILVHFPNHAFSSNEKDD